MTDLEKYQDELTSKGILWTRGGDVFIHSDLRGSDTKLYAIEVKGE